MALYTLAPQPWLIFLDDGGLYIPNGQLAVYAAGTSTPATVYTSAAGTAHPFPITLDGAGRVPGGLYLEPGRSYKFVLHAPQIEDPLDGAILKTQDHVAATPSSLVSVLTLTTPGDFTSINVSGVDIIEYTGAGDLTIRGMVGGVVGQSILIRNLTQNTIWLTSLDLTAPVGSALTNLFATGSTPLVGGRGSACYSYTSVNDWRMVAHEQGAPLTLPFSAANYGGGGTMTWTVEPGDVLAESVYITGRSVRYSFNIRTTSIGGTPVQSLTRLLPYGWQSLTTNYAVAILVSEDGLTSPPGVAQGFDATRVAFNRTPVGTAWTVRTNTVSVYGQVDILLN